MLDIATGATQNTVGGDYVVAMVTGPFHLNSLGITSDTTSGMVAAILDKNPEQNQLGV
jgi:hypothetical protein